MYFGNAVVVSDRVGCGPDLVEDKGTGYVFPVGDVEALASILIRLDKDRASLSLMQSNAKDLIQRTSFGSVADAIIRAIEESKLRSVATRRRLRTIE
jgi:glycosyltransferase involved in cell wall biosynthesis